MTTMWRNNLIAVCVATICRVRVRPAVCRAATPAIVMAIMVAVALVTVPEANAQGDGGGRSVFATGAGNRALGLGGAYGAVADDASAVLWNPAGLGLVDRRQLQATTVSYFGLDIHEHYGSLALPHWRWGVASITMRRFGVSNIEHRDERNVLLSSDLSDQQMEFVLGYGRRLNRSWSVGGSIKLQSQSTAGFSDSDLGMDIGVMARPLEILAPQTPWAERFTVGLALRNVLEPELRLANDLVADPTAMRLGFSFWAPFIENHPFLLSADIEKTQGMNTRLHAGLEVHVRSHLALRSGFNSQNFTAGASVAWRSVAIDYVMEQNQIDRLHRFGATLAFGPTVEEQRQASETRRDQALREQLIDAFDHTQDQRIRDLIARAREAMQEGEFEDALETLAIVDALEPNRPESSTLQVECWRGLARNLERNGNIADAVLSYARAVAIQPNDPLAKAGLERTRSTSDREAARTSAIRQHFAAGMDAFSRYNLAAARDEFALILAENPGDADARMMHQRTLRAIENRKTDLALRCRGTIERGQFNEARDRIAEIRALDPGAAEIDELVDRLQAATKRAQREKTTTTPSNVDAAGSLVAAAVAKPLSAAQKQEADRLYQRGMVAMEGGRMDEAVKYWELVWTMNPDHSHVSEHLQREYLQRGIVAFSDGNLNRAIEMWENVLRFNPDNERASGYLRRAREQMARTKQILGE